MLVRSAAAEEKGSLPLSLPLLNHFWWEHVYRFRAQGSPFILRTFTGRFVLVCAERGSASISCQEGSYSNHPFLVTTLGRDVNTVVARILVSGFQYARAAHLLPVKNAANGWKVSSLAAPAIAHGSIDGALLDAARGALRACGHATASTTLQSSRFGEAGVALCSVYPGDLRRAHRRFGGTANANNCHTMFPTMHPSHVQPKPTSAIVQPGFSA